MATQRFRPQTGAAGGPLQDPAAAVSVEPAAGELANSSDPAKNSSGRNVRFGEPAAQDTNRSGYIVFPKGNTDLATGHLLVSLRTAEVDDQAVISEGEVGRVDRDRF